MWALGACGGDAGFISVERGSGVGDARGAVEVGTDADAVRMPMRYGEHVMAARGGIARVAREQGRDTASVAYSTGIGAASPLSESALERSLVS